MNKYFSLLLLLCLGLASCASESGKSNKEKKKVPFLWENANMYFLLTDRFCNGDPGNDINYGRSKETGKLRNFMGGDFKGITQKIKEGYFDDLGITALWFSPVAEQVHGGVDEGTGMTYGYHGYWAKDWTSIDANYGTEEELEELVKEAHAHGIRIVMDVVINHTGPVTPKDPVWDADWVRTTPHCGYFDYNSTVLCTLVENLPDVKTESRKEADLPKALAEKWKKEGRYEQEVRELDEFFKRTGLPRYPRNYHIKWLVDFVEKYGIDGFRVDTAKHTEADLWAELEKYANIALNNWKKKHPEQVLDDNEFYMVGEVYGYNINNKLIFNYSDRAVDFFANGFKSLINFGFKYDSEGSYEELFAKYDKLLQQSLKGKSVLNYATSHDDGEPMDQLREKPYKVANMLLLAPGAAQIYYGDETNRSLVIDGTVGDATLRSFMNWEDLEVNNVLAGQPVRKVLAYWQKLGKFRASHPAVGAGNHKMLQEKPYVFGRTFKKGTFQDQVVIGLEMPKGKKSIPVGSFFANGTELTDMFSGKKAVVENGKIVLDTPGETVLLEK